MLMLIRAMTRIEGDLNGRSKEIVTRAKAGCRGIHRSGNQAVGKNQKLGPPLKYKENKLTKKKARLGFRDWSWKGGASQKKKMFLEGPWAGDMISPMGHDSKKNQAR